MASDIGIVVTRDIHGDFGRLNAWVNHRRPSIILQCGDFGYWPRYVSKRKRKRGQPQVPNFHDTRLYWCDGNHEDFVALAHRETDEVIPNVIYMPRCSTLQLPDEHTVLFIGGAESHDKEWRVEQESAGGDKVCFAEERVTGLDLRNLPDEKVDVIV